MLTSAARRSAVDTSLYLRYGWRLRVDDAGDHGIALLRDEDAASVVPHVVHGPYDRAGAFVRGDDDGGEGGGVQRHEDQGEQTPDGHQHLPAARFWERVVVAAIEALERHPQLVRNRFEESHGQDSHGLLLSCDFVLVDRVALGAGWGVFPLARLPVSGVGVYATHLPRRAVIPREDPSVRLLARHAVTWESSRAVRHAQPC